MKELTVQSFTGNVPEPGPESAARLAETLPGIALDNANWAAFPYTPEVSFRIACSPDYFHLSFTVREDGLRAVCDKINGEVYQDSCVEFFLAPGDEPAYYNFEFSCIGVPHVAYGTSRHDRQRIDPEVLSGIRTHSTLGNKPFGVLPGLHSWQLQILIPLNCLVHHPGIRLTGLTARANFYKCGDLAPRPHFLSWNPVSTPEPDFHQQRYFGKLYFV
ncbi:MAG: carbohydrate-binding family 9-like protein [Bacteroidota bacterium]